MAPKNHQKQYGNHDFICGHELLIDAPPPDLTQPVPKDDQHRHFGGGQTETTVTLAPGRHTPQLLLGDFAYVPHQPPVASKAITITVE